MTMKEQYFNNCLVKSSLGKIVIFLIMQSVCRPGKSRFLLRRTPDGLTGLKLKLKLKQSLAAISTQGPLAQTSRRGEACTGLPVCTVSLPSEPVLIEEFPESQFNQ